MSAMPSADRGYGAIARELLHPWRGQLAGAVVCVAAASGLDLVPPLVMGRLVDENLQVGVAQGLLGLALTYLGALVGAQLLRTATSILAAVVAQGTMRTLRVRLYEHLLRLPISYHDVTPLGETISRCTSDLETVNSLFSLGMVSLLSQVVAVLATLAAMIVLSPVLSLIMIILAPIIYVLTRAFQRRMRDAERQVRRGVGLINARLQEILAGAEVIRALNKSGSFLRLFRQALLEGLRATNLSVWYGALYSPAMDVLAACTVAALFVLGGQPHGEASGWMSVTLSAGTLTSFVLLVNRFFDPIIALGEEWGTAQAALAGLERVLQVLRIPEEDRSAVGAKAPAEEAPAEPEVALRGGGPVAEPLVNVEHLTFGYQTGDPVLIDVSLRVPSGRHVAIVGRTGAGKSSLFSLIGGLYRPWSGTVRVAGRDPFLLAPEERQSILGPVPQNVQLFTGTLRQNLTLDEDDAEAPVDDAALERALELVGAASLVRALPQGLDTVLSDQGGGTGVQLSAGQKQLLALARALVHNPRLLLLDEATASVDSATEASFRQGLRAHIQQSGGSVLTIAHRLATALEADEVVVLSEGRIVEQGTPQDLLERGGILASLWELERSGWA